MTVDRVLVETRGTITRAALMEGDRLVELLFEDRAAPGILGNLYLGRVRKVVPGLKAAFVDIGGDRQGFLPLPPTGGATEGEAVTVQAVREAEEDKGPKLAPVSDIPVPAGARPPLLLRAAPPLTERLRAEHGAVESVSFEEVGLDGQIAEALAPQVALPSGGGLVIEETTALVAIDVNAGPGAAGGKEEAALAVNIEAAAEVARQIRLRDLGGLLVVDFLKMKKDANRKKVLAALRQAAKDDPAPVHVLGFTALGLVEMTRRRRGESLARRLTTACPACGGSGRTSRPEATLPRLLAALEREARAAPGQRLRVKAAPALLALLPEPEGRFGHPPVLEARADFPLDHFEVLSERP